METLVAGSYDRFLFGYQCSTSGSTEEPPLKRIFTHPAHKVQAVRDLLTGHHANTGMNATSVAQGPIKCIAAAAPYLVSGGADDLIHLYDIQAGSDLGFLMSPGDGAVSALAFYVPERGRPPSHLLSGAADGSISVWQAGGEWICLKSLRGHKKQVNSISVHPSGRLALSTSTDSTLRLWNLVKGKCAHTTALSIAADQVAFAPSGDSYGLVRGPEVVLHDIGADAPRLTLVHPKRPLCLAFCSETAILTGSEDGAVRLWDPRAGGEPALVVPKAHASRVRAIAPFSGSLGDAHSVPGLVASASTDGTVRVWDLRKLASVNSGSPVVAPLAEASTGARLICLTAMNASAATSRSKIRADAGDKPSQQSAAVEPAAPKAKKSKKKAILSREEPAVQEAEQLPASAGVAHDGVVEFPEGSIGKGGKKQAKRRKAAASLAIKANGGIGNNYSGSKSKAKSRRSLKVTQNGQ